MTPLLREHHHSMETTLFPEKFSYNLCICNSIKGPSLFRGNGPFFEDPKVGFNHSHESTCKTSKNQSDITTSFLSTGYFEKIEGILANRSPVHVRNKLLQVAKFTWCIITCAYPCHSNRSILLSGIQHTTLQSFNHSLLYIVWCLN